MHTVIMVVHVILAVCLVCVILMQRSEGGALGGLGGGMGSFMTGRSVGNVLTRMTAILATCFMVTSLTLAIMSKSEAAKAQKSFMEEKPAVVQTEPAAPQAPVVPVSSK